MSERRTLADRLIARVQPRVDAGFAPPLRAIDADLFSLDRRIVLPGGVRFPTRSVLVRLPGGGIFVHSPFHLDPATRDEVAALGPVAHVVAPNSVHYLYAREWLEAWPNASFHLAPGLAERRPELPRGETLGDTPPAAWAATLDQAVYGPVRGMSEVAFLHRPSGTLLLSDAAFHLTRAERLRERLVYRVYGIHGRFAVSLTARRLLLTDPVAVGRFVERLLAWPLRRILVAHGEPLEDDPAGALRAAFARELEASRAAGA